ncbi:MAG TPA: hypothetical protein VI197_28800 [Polyangiaceae bacterium]
MDTPPELSAEVKSFLRGWLTSYEQLQTLLLLRQRRDESFSPQAIAEILHASDIVAEEALEHLRGVSLVEVSVGSTPRSYKYAPGSIHLSGLVEQLADAWDRHQLAVMNQMSANAIERVRTGAIRTFADAFVLGKKKTDG